MLDLYLLLSLLILGIVNKEVMNFLFLERTSGRRGRNSLHEVDPEHFLKVPAGYKCTQCQRHLPTPDKAVGEQ